MSPYETLDTIADAYTPVLAIASLTFIVVALFKTDWRIAWSRFLMLGAVLAIAYGLMFFDNRFGIWRMLGLDYSTHTAVALVLIAFLSAIRPRLIIPLIGSLIAYVLLMLYQGYHTVLDIASTAFVVIIPTWLVVARHCSCWPFVITNSPLKKRRGSVGS